MKTKNKIQKTLWMGVILFLLLIVSCSLVLFKSNQNQITRFDSQTSGLMTSGFDGTGLTIGATETGVTFGCPNSVKNASVPTDKWIDDFWDAGTNKVKTSAQLAALSAAQGNFFQYEQTNQAVQNVTEYYTYKNNAYILLTSENIPTLLYESGALTEDTTIDWLKTYYLDEESSEQALFYYKHGRDGMSASTAFVISNAKELAFLGAAFSARGTSGTQNTAQNLYLPLNSYFELDADIDLSGKAWTPLVDFRYTQGTTTYFNGNNHTISGAIVDQSDWYRNNTTDETYYTTSIFGCFPQGKISNLTITNACVKGNISAGIVARSYNATNFENILVQNSYVSSIRHTAGISGNAGDMINCRVENCEITATGYDPAADPAAINRNDYYYVMGIGRGNNISLTGALSGTDIVKNSVIHFSQVLNGYNPLSRTIYDYAYVYGVGYNRATSDANVGNFTLTNNKVFADVEVLDSNGNASGFNTDRFYLNVFGGYAYTSGGQNNVQIHDITMTNCFVNADFNYKPTDTTKNGNMAFHAETYVAGIARLSNTRAETTHYKNLLVDKCDITSDINIKPCVAPSGTTQRTFNGYAYVQGVFYTDSALQKAENCNIQNSNVTAHTNFVNNTQQSGASFSTTVVLNGVGGSSSMDSRTDYVNCSAENCVFDAENSENFRVEEDSSNSVRNAFSNNIYLSGIGRGLFLQDEDDNPCSVKNVEFNAKSNVARGDNDSISSCSSTVRAVGIGFNVSGQNGNFDGVTIEDATFNVEGTCGTANKVGSNYVSAVGYSQSSNSGLTVTYKDVQTKNVVINAVGNYNYIAGQAYASKSLNGMLNVTDSIIEDLTINEDSTNGSYIAGVVYNTSSNAGITIKNVALDRVSLTANANLSVANAAAIANIAGTSNLSTIQNNTVKNCDISANSTGSNAYASGLVYCTTPVALTNNTVEKCSIEAVSKAYDTYAAGMVLQTNSTNGLNSTIQNCYAIDNDVLAEFQTGGTASVRTVGAYGIAGYYIKSVDGCAVTNGTVRALNAVGYAYAEGIAGTWGVNLFTNRPSSATNAPLTSITNSYNFADVKATTEGSYSTGASGIGQAEYIDSCVNYGKVTGNYVGGITRGFYQSTNGTSTIYSSPLIVKNCTNAADVCRADTGGISYVGGIIGVYYMNSLANVNLVLENNASMGGVYSKLQLDGTYSQNLSPSTYLGTLYGLLRIRTGVSNSDIQNKSDNYLEALSNYSIKNNYSLVEENGINGGLYRTPETGAILTYSKNIPSSTYMASSDGVYYDGVSISNNYDVVLKDLYTYCSTIETNVNSNKIITSNYDDTTFTISSALQQEYGWKQMSLNGNVYPQVEIEFAKQVVMFSLSGFEGTTPNVIIADITGTDFTFTAPTTTLTQVGVSINGWQYGENTFTPNTSVTQPKQAHLITFYATTSLTSYTITFKTGTDVYNQGSVRVNGTPASTVNLTSTNIVLWSNFTGDESVTVSAITWQVKNGDADTYTNIAFKQTSEKQNNTLDIDDIFGSEFLSNYATSDNKLVFNAIYETTLVYTITFSNVTGGEDDYLLSATVGGISVVNGNTAKVLKGSNVTITVTPNKHYEFVEYQVTPESEATSSESSATLVLSNVAKNYTVQINVEKVEYALSINVVNIQNVALPIDDATMANLIDNFASLPTISVDEDLPTLQANLNCEGYRFVGWKLLGMSDYINATDGQIDAGFPMGSEDLDRYIIHDKFNVTAVFQRQYNLNITMQNPGGDSFLSTYVVNYIDENGVEQNLTNVVTEEITEVITTIDENEEIIETTVTHTVTRIESEGSYLIDENTFVKIFVQPNKRVRVLDPSGVEFGGNTAYVYLTQNQDVEFVFEVRPLSIKAETMNVTDVDSFDGKIEASLSGATDYVVNDGSDDYQNPATISLDNTLTLSYNAYMLENLAYRFIGVYLYNVQTGSYDAVETIVVDDDFFDNYVTEDGNVAIMLKVIKQYKVIITAENLSSADHYELGSYEVIVKDGNVVLDNTSEKYNEIEENVSYLLDTGLSVVIQPTVLSDYAHFVGYSGVFEAELNDLNIDANATIDSDRAISLRFEKNTYNIDTRFDAAVGGKFATTQTFQLGDTIVISYTPENNYQILDWKLAGKSLSDWNATKVGNTVKVVATEDFLSELQNLHLFNGDTITLENDLKTMMNPTMFYGLIGGGVLIVLLAGLITFLLIRSAKLKRAKLEQERKLNDIARKFNIAGMISDLKSGKNPDVFDNTKSKK